jgi:hypothetical protein
MFFSNFKTPCKIIIFKSFENPIQHLRHFFYTKLGVYLGIEIHEVIISIFVFETGTETENRSQVNRNTKNED